MTKFTSCNSLSDLNLNIIYKLEIFSADYFDWDRLND